MAEMPELAIGDWVRAAEGWPQVIVVEDIGVWRNEPCVFDGHGGALHFEAIAEVRKTNGVCWVRPGPMTPPAVTAPADPTPN